MLACADTTTAKYANNLQWQRWLTGMSTLEKAECRASVPGQWEWFGENGALLSEQCTPCYDYDGPCNQVLPDAPCSTFRTCLPADYGGANGFASRFNWCMGNLSRLSTCVDHVDCTGVMTWAHWTDSAFNYLYDNDVRGHGSPPLARPLDRSPPLAIPDPRAERSPHPR